MVIKKVVSVYFSATGNTEKVVKAIAKGTGLEEETYNFTRLGEAAVTPVFSETDLVIIGAPVYVGRVPKVIINYLKSVKGNSTPVVIAGTFGNRHYDDFFTELEDLTKEQGFIPVGAAMFTAEHSFSTELGTDRPNKDDILIAENFGKQVIEKLNKADNAIALEAGKIPGNRPYREPFASGPPLGPVVDDKCIDCGLCATLCPTMAINPENVRDINPEKCIRCRACARNCPVKAIDFTNEMFWGHTKHLIEEYGKIDWDPILVI